MKGFQLSSGILLITIGLLSLQTELVSAAYTMNETCSYIVQGWIADPTDCQSYAYCKGGKMQGPASCPDGLLFDRKSGECLPAAQVTCSSSVADICKIVDSPQLIADPDNCNNVCYCDGNGASECSKCPDNQSFDPQSQSCVWSSKYNCPADSICRLVPNNMFAGDPNKCGNYLSCVNGAGTSTACANNQYYNALTGICQNNNPCDTNSGDDGETSSDAGPGVIQNLPANPSACANYAKDQTDDTKSYFYSDGKTCMGFYSCASATGPGTWSKCPTGTHFNPSEQQCVTPYTYLCPYDRCGNIKQAFVTKASATDTTCKNYLYCVNQTTQPGSGGACPTGYEYFNEPTGDCVPTKPDYIICGGSA